MTVLLLGGTGEARELADRLAALRPDLRVVSSLAGRVRDPRLPVGQVRIGGFGGVAGLAAWLATERVGAVVDATHPFAGTITEHALVAARAAGVPLLVLRRPGWTAEPGDDWHRVPDLAGAAGALDRFGKRVLLTIGRQGVGAFAGCAAHRFLVRAIDPPDPPTPPRMRLLLARGPFDLAGEVDLLARERIDVLVSKDSGGAATVAKLVAARRLGVPVVLVDRPPLPAGTPVVATIEAAVAWLAGTVGG